MSKFKSPDFDKKQAFNRIWFKKGNSPMRDRLKAKVENRGLEPSEKICFEYYMGYIKPIRVAYGGKTIHANPRWSKFNEKKRDNKPRRMGGHNKKKRRRP